MHLHLHLSSMQAIAAVVAREKYDGSMLPSIKYRDRWLSAESGDEQPPVAPSPSPPSSSLSAPRLGILNAMDKAVLSPPVVTLRYTRPDFPAGAQGADQALEHALGTSLSRAYRSARRLQGTPLEADIGLPLDLITWDWKAAGSQPPPLTVLREDASSDVAPRPLLRVPREASARSLGCLMLREWAIRAEVKNSPASLTPRAMLISATGVAWAAELHAAYALGGIGAAQMQASWRRLCDASTLQVTALLAEVADSTKALTTAKTDDASCLVLRAMLSRLSDAAAAGGKVFDCLAAVPSAPPASAQFEPNDALLRLVKRWERIGNPSADAAAEPAGGLVRPRAVQRSSSDASDEEGEEEEDVEEDDGEDDEPTDGLPWTSTQVGKGLSRLSKRLTTVGSSDDVAVQLQMRPAHTDSASAGGAGGAQHTDPIWAVRSAMMKGEALGAMRGLVAVLSSIEGLAYALPPLELAELTPELDRVRAAVATAAAPSTLTAKAYDDCTLISVPLSQVFQSSRLALTPWNGNVIERCDRTSDLSSPSLQCAREPSPISPGEVLRTILPDPSSGASAALRRTSFQIVVDVHPSRPRPQTQQDTRCTYRSIQAAVEGGKAQGVQRLLWPLQGVVADAAARARASAAAFTAADAISHAAVSAARVSHDPISGLEVLYSRLETHPLSQAPAGRDLLKRVRGAVDESRRSADAVTAAAVDPTRAKDSLLPQLDDMPLETLLLDLAALQGGRYTSTADAAAAVSDVRRIGDLLNVRFAAARCELDALKASLLAERTSLHETAATLLAGLPFVHQPPAETTTAVAASDEGRTVLSLLRAAGLAPQCRLPLALASTLSESGPAHLVQADPAAFFQSERAGRAATYADAEALAKRALSTVVHWASLHVNVGHIATTLRTLKRLVVHIDSMTAGLRDAYIAASPAAATLAAAPLLRLSALRSLQHTLEAFKPDVGILRSQLAARRSHASAPFPGMVLLDPRFVYTELMLLSLLRDRQVCPALLPMYQFVFPLPNHP
jgi:hypothetical protein